jgi:hypothetical protein
MARAANFLLPIVLVLFGTLVSWRFSHKAGLLVILIGLWMILFLLVERAPVRPEDSAYLIMRKSWEEAASKGKLIFLLGFLLVCYVAYFATERVVASFLGSVFLFSFFATIFSREKSLGSFAVPALLLFGTVYALLRVF